MGRVLLAALDPEEARARILAGKPTALTPHTVTEIGKLMEILAQVRTEGHAIVDQELELGLVSLAMPLVNGRGQVAAAFNLSVQSQRVAGDEIETNLLPRMRAMQKLLQPLIA
jgi:IclR family pca regulon transcriptional regulator